MASKTKSFGRYFFNKNKNVTYGGPPYNVVPIIIPEKKLPAG